MLVAALGDKVVRGDVTVLLRVDSGTAAVVRATRTATLLLEETSGTEVGISFETIVVDCTGKASGRGAPSVLTTTGGSVDSFVVRRERAVTSATELGTAVSRLGAVVAAVTTEGCAGTEVVVIG